jgi:hypothetical protein
MISHTRDLNPQALLLGAFGHPSVLAYKQRRSGVLIDKRCF